MKNHALSKSIIALTAICLITAIALAAVDYVTAPRIAENERIAENKALRVVLPEGSEFIKVDDLSIFEGLPKNVTAVYKDKTDKGFVFRLSTAGYSKGLVILCGVSSDGVISGAVCLASKETLGAEKTFGERFAGLDLDGAKKVDTVARVTRTSVAYKNAVQDALRAFELVKNVEIIETAEEGGGDN